jgi:hypothetical protein
MAGSNGPLGTHYRVKSTNWWSAINNGGYTQWIHIDSGATGRVTIYPVLSPTTGLVSKPILLQTVTINNSGGTGSIVVADSEVSTIADFKTSVTEKDYHYNIPIRGNLTIDTNGSDMIICYARD